MYQVAMRVEEDTDDSVQGTQEVDIPYLLAQFTT
jgi:hypothetical protein